MEPGAELTYIPKTGVGKELPIAQLKSQPAVTTSWWPPPMMWSEYDHHYKNLSLVEQTYIEVIVPSNRFLRVHKCLIINLW